MESMLWRGARRFNDPDQIARPGGAKAQNDPDHGLVQVPGVRWITAVSLYLIMLGFLLQWPTLLTVLMFPCW